MHLSNVACRDFTFWLKFISIQSKKKKKDATFGRTNNYRPNLQTCFAMDDFYCGKYCQYWRQNNLEASVYILLMTSDWLLTTISTSSVRQNFHHGFLHSGCVWPLVCSLRREYCVRESQNLAVLCLNVSVLTSQGVPLFILRFQGRYQPADGPVRKRPPVHMCTVWEKGNITYIHVLWRCDFTRRVCNILSASQLSELASVDERSECSEDLFPERDLTF